MIKTWDEIKQSGNILYKNNGGVEQLDVYKADGSIWDWCINEMRAKSARNIKARHKPYEKFIEDMDEIIHHAEILKTVATEIERGKLET